MWVVFERDFLWTPARDRRVSVQYLAGMVLRIARAAALAAEASGSAVLVTTPTRAEAALIENRTGHAERG